MKWKKRKIGKTRSRLTTGKTVGPDADAWKRARGWEQRMTADSAARKVTPEVLGAALEILEWLGRDGWHRSGYMQTEIQIRSGSKPNFGILTMTEIKCFLGSAQGGSAEGGKAESAVRWDAVRYLESVGLVESREQAGGGAGRPTTLVRLVRPAGDLIEAKAELVSDMLCARFPPGSRVTLFGVRLVLPRLYADSEKLTRALMWQLCQWGDCKPDPVSEGARADAWVFV